MSQVGGAILGEKAWSLPATPSCAPVLQRRVARCRSPWSGEGKECHDLGVVSSTVPPHKITPPQVACADPVRVTRWRVLELSTPLYFVPVSYAE